MPTVTFESRPSLFRRGATWWRELLLIGALYGAYELTRGFSDVDINTAFANGREILHLEHVWHLAPEGVLNKALAQVTFIAVIASYFYSVMHYIMTPLVLVWMYRKHNRAYGQARTTLAASTAIALVGYVLVPTAPPRMIKGSGLQDILAETKRWGWWDADGSVPRGLGSLSNQFAAMPSMHVGWAIWCGVLIAIFARRRWVKAIGIAYPIVTTVIVMATGNHYLLDAVAGAVTMGVGAGLAYGLPRLMSNLVPSRPSLRLPHRLSLLVPWRPSQPLKSAALGPRHESLQAEPEHESLDAVPEFYAVRD